MSIRDDIIKEALEWVRTPYHHEARIKQVGVDCAQLLIGVYSAVGVIPEFETGQYPPDWHLHREQEVFRAWVEDFAYEIPEGEQLPGDIVLVKFGRGFSHGAIVYDYPLCIHAVKLDRQVSISSIEAGDCENRERVFYRLKGI